MMLQCIGSMCCTGGYAEFLFFHQLVFICRGMATMAAWLFFCIKSTKGASEMVCIDKSMLNAVRPYCGPYSWLAVSECVHSVSAHRHWLVISLTEWVRHTMPFEHKHMRRKKYVYKWITRHISTRAEQKEDEGESEREINDQRSQWYNQQIWSFI